MQTTLDSFPLYQRSRLKGVLRFHLLKVSRLLLWLLGLMLASQVLSFLLAAFHVADYTASGITTDFGTAMLLMLVLAILLAKSGSTFLLRFGTPRLSVWLGSLISLFLGGAAFLLGALLLNVLANYLALLLSHSHSAFVVSQYFGELSGSELLASTLGDALRALPMQLLWVLEWACLLYLLGCCFRRYRVATLAVCIVGPLVFFLLMLTPAIRQAVEIVESGDSNAMMVTGLKWMQWLSKTARFVSTNWQCIQGAAALVSLPLSYWCMRGTAQP